MRNKSIFGILNKLNFTRFTLSSPNNLDFIIKLSKIGMENQIETQNASSVTTNRSRNTQDDGYSTVSSGSDKKVRFKLNF